MSQETKIRFTKEALLALPVSSKRTRYRDSKVEGLVLDVLVSSRKVFRVYKRVRGLDAPVSVTIGQFPSVTIEQARKEAFKALSEISQGVNPNELERATRRSHISLHQVYEDYKSRKALATKTIVGYDQVMRAYLADWHEMPIHSITELLVKNRHRELTASSPAQADLCMRLVRALFNFAMHEYKGVDDESIFTKNPVHVLSHQKLWNHVGRKQTRIDAHKIKQWYEAITRFRNDHDEFVSAVCDCVEIALFTGLRKSELLSLPWVDVDLDGKVFSVEKTKNGDPVLLPISTHLLTIFQRRRLASKGEYVFQADNKYGYIREPKKIIKKLVEASGVAFGFHDLRRTFASTAELLGLGVYTLKRLLNHRTRRDDVTAGYTVLSAEELRVPAQKIETRLLELAGVNVVQHDTNELLAMIDRLSEADRQKLISRLSVHGI